jgi:hypothetical protein
MLYSKHQSLPGPTKALTTLHAQLSVSQAVPALQLLHDWLVLVLLTKLALHAHAEPVMLKPKTVLAVPAVAQDEPPEPHRTELTVRNTATASGVFKPKTMSEAVSNSKTLKPSA